MNNEILLSAKSISKSFESRKVLDNVDVQIESGKIVTLIGPNGAGKTTLVRILLGLLQADSGELFKKPDVKVGYMPQRIHIDPTLPLTVGRFLSLAERNDSGHIRQTLDDLKISHLQEQQLASISGGQLQRVLLARAIIRKPPLLILDEPAQGVDLAGQAELYELVSDLGSKNGCGILMISHDLHLVMSSTDEVICLNHHICCHGKPEQVSTDPAYLDLFGARASQNLAVYTHHHNHEHDLTGQVKDSHDD